MIVCLAGNPSIDKLFEVDHLRAGEIHRPDAFVKLPGGKGIHVAQVATALGARAVVCGLLAGHAGRWIVEQLAAEGVAHRFAWGAGETRSSLSVADTATGSLTEFYEDGPEVSVAEWQDVRVIVDELLPGADWLALAGTLPRGASSFGELIAATRARGVRCAVDSRADGLRAAIEAQPDVVKINVHEAAELLGGEVATRAQVCAAATEIRARAGGSGRAVLVTRGPDGMVLADPDGVCWEGCQPDRAPYPVGSGDAFLGGLLVGLQEGAPWPAAAGLALGAAAANAEQRGAGYIDPARARALAAGIEVRRV